MVIKTKYYVSHDMGEMILCGDYIFINLNQVNIFHAGQPENSTLVTLGGNPRNITIPYPPDLIKRLMNGELQAIEMFETLYDKSKKS